MKKKIMTLLALAMSMANVWGYSVDTTHPPFYFEGTTNGVGRLEPGNGKGWLVDNTIYAVTNHGDLTADSGPNFYRIAFAKDGVAVKCWGLSASQNIGAATWLDNTASTNFLCAYDSSYAGSSKVWLYLWLKWMRYGLSFEPNGGTACDSVQDICYTNSIALPKPERTGYDFQGWTNSTLTEAISGSRTGSELGVMEDGQAVVLYAKWKPKTFTVTLDANGDGASVSPGSISVTYDSTYSNLPTPTRPSYAFAGWFTEATAGSQVQTNTVVSITENQTLYAHWSQLFTVTFQNSTGQTIYKQYTDVPYGSRVEPPDISEVPAPVGKLFTGTWSSSEYENVTRNLIILPKFEDIETTLTYSCDPTAGGTCSHNNNGYGLYEYGRTVTITATPHDAYDFAGWDDGVMDNPRNVTVISDTNLVARFSLKKFAVNFLDWDGSTQIDSRTVEYGSAADAPDAPEHPGYTFTGWDADISGVVSNITTVAQYESNRYTVVYDANGGGGTMTNDVFTYGEEYALQSNGYARAMYEFVGWASTPDAATNEVLYADGAVASNLTEVANGTNTLYAVWSSLLSGLSDAVGCTNLILTCANANQMWEVDGTAGYEGGSSAKTKGSKISKMTAAAAGSGTVTFWTRTLSPAKVLFNEQPRESTGISTDGEWKCYSFELSDDEPFLWQGTMYDNEDAACWVDKVRWYPNRFVNVPSNKVTDDEKYEIKAAILESWVAILGADAESVTTANAGGDVTNAVSLLERGVMPEVQIEGTTATLTFDNGGEVTKVPVAVPAIAEAVYTGELQTADVVSSSLYTVVNEGGTDAGDYPVVLTLTDADRYCWAGGDSNPTSLTFTITKAANEWIAEPSLSTNSWISGETPDVPDMGEAKFGTVALTYSGESGESGTECPTQVGQYVATFMVEETGNYAGLVKEIPFSIVKTDEEARIEEALAGLPVTIEKDGTGGWKITLTEGISSGITIPDDIGAVTIDTQGNDLAGEDGQPAVSVVRGTGSGNPTQLSLVASTGASVLQGGEGMPAIMVADDVQDGVVINIGENVVVQSGGMDVPAVIGEIGVNEGEIAKVALQIPSIADAEYTGEPQTASVSDSELYRVVQNDGGTAAGAYPVVLEIVDTNNYCWAGGDSNPTSLTFTIAKAVNEWIAEPSITGWKYGEAPGEPEMGEAKFGTVSVGYRMVDGAALDGVPTELGDYVAVFSVEETDNWTGLVAEEPFRVSAADESLRVGEYFKATLAELGYEVPTNGTPYTVVAKGLPAGLKLKYNAAVKNKKGKVVTKAKTTWWIEGVPTAALDFMTNPPYLVITANGTTTTVPLSMEVLAQDVTELEDLALGQAVNEQYYLPGVTSGWTVTGLPTGLKYTAKVIYKDPKAKKKVVKYPAYTVYGKTTKAGLFTITAKKKKGAFYETMKYRVLVTPKAVDATYFGEALTNITTMAYVAMEWNVTGGVDVATSASLPVVPVAAKVTGLPAGLTFAAATTYKDKKKTVGKQYGQTIKGKPTKAGTYVVTFTRNVKSGKKTVAKTAQILWKVVANDAELSLGFNTEGGEIESGTVGLKYGDLMAFTATSDATVMASGLPAGITLANLGEGNYAFTGFTTKAGTYLVTVKATLNGKSVTQRIALKVDGLPVWAKGTFNGYVEGAEGTTNGLATVTVSAAGKISGKFYEGGTNWTLSAASYTAYDEATPAYSAPVAAKYAYKVKEKVKGKLTSVTKYVTRNFTLSVSQDGLGGVATLEEDDGGSVVQAWQNLWGSTYKTLGKTLFSTKSGKKTLAYTTLTLKGTDDDDQGIGLWPGTSISLKVTTAWAVTATMTFNTGKKTKKGAVVYYKPACATVVIPKSEVDVNPFTGEVFLFYPPSVANNFYGFAACLHLSKDL